ncbi:MAG: UDP-N-acetylmuramoyl-L-alanyl-D-glutamate--2,6-diaminopimelate ligase [Candidatus Glassbacteria bacterium]|nr:UDP-N-acetylmuramoyl-L-alanyl-D-glutamate--2,6-diaminopimelate ligase [Candidatus Glassbacteria bacterium]
MRLTTLLGAIGAVSPRGPVKPAELGGLAIDSRQVKPGDVFFALEGTQSDGHDYVQMAADKGALAAVVSREVPGAAVEQFVVPDTREALALAACEFYDHPSLKFPLIGVTGTNGKTTIAFLIRQILGHEGIICGLLGTVCNILGPDRREPSELTTMQAHEIQQKLALMLDYGCRSAVMEVSSHGLDQKRNYGCCFQVAVFTNLTPDHLDYHPDMEHYYRAKSLLFESLGKQGRAVIGWDDPYGARLAKGIDGPLITYGERPGSSVRIVSWRPLPVGAEVELEVFGKRIGGPVGLLGRFNAQNIAAAVAAGYALGIQADSLQRVLPILEPVPGRMEPVEAGQPSQVLVDYAHTPDALEKALKAAREHTHGRLICLFGCGGCRYREKRPAMGRIAVGLSDLTYITSDNPRREKPEEIVGQIVAGAKEAGARQGKDFMVEPDRRAAIFSAVAGMQPGDTLLIAGKGHEDYQILPTGKIHFDDREVALEALKEQGYCQS